MLATPPSTPTKRVSAASGATPRKTPKTPASPYGDRFIPHRSNIDFELGNWNLIHETSAGTSKCGSPAKDQYRSTIHAAAFDGKKIAATSTTPQQDSASSKILSFREKPPAASDAYRNSLRVLHSQAKVTAAAGATRFIDPVPERTLDAPHLLDDYYLNLISWSSRNVIAVALGNSVYLWDPVTSAISELVKEDRNSEMYISSVSFCGDGSYVAVGTSEHVVHVYDVQRMRLVRSMSGHSGRVSSLAWNSHMLTSGGRDSRIIHHDVRVAQHQVSLLEHHQQEVCGLQWSPDGQQLASGGNDNICCVWDAGQTTPKHAFTAHTAAVKALAWSPHQSSLLASGGGTADRCIRFWNTSTGACLNTVDTKSQVCALQWSKQRNEVISSHGFSQNQLIVWKYPTMSKLAELTGHTARVLHLAQSPDGCTVVSAAADETLRFWRIATPERKGTPGRSGKREGLLSALSGADLIR